MKTLALLARLIAFVAAFVALSACEISSRPDRPEPVVIEHGDGPSFRKGELEHHFHKHGAEVGAATKEEYLAKARALVARKGVLTHHRAGDTLYFDPDTDEFAVVSGKGVLRTYFKPSHGKAYWEKQKQKADDGEE